MASLSLVTNNMTETVTPTLLLPPSPMQISTPQTNKGFRYNAPILYYTHTRTHTPLATSPLSNPPAFDQPPIIAHDPHALHLLLDPARADIAKQKTRLSIQRLTRKSGSRGLQPAQPYSWRHVAPAVSSCKVLQDGPNHPDVASLDVLPNVVEEALALLGRDAALWEHAYCVGHPLCYLLGHELEEIEEHA
jgi:hypothetical protein